MDRGKASLESRHADHVKFGELVAGLGPDYEEGCWSTLHKLVGSWSRSPDEPRAKPVSIKARCVAWQAGFQESVYVRPPHGPLRCVNE